MTTGRNGTDTHKVTIEDINKVTEQLRPDELKLLYDNLGIDHVKVEHVEASAGTTNTRLKGRAVLREWMQEKGSSATCEDLFGERDKIIKRRTEQSKADTKELNLKECQEQLLESYLGPDKKVQLTPWDPDHAVEMDTIFVNLELEKDEVCASQTKQIPLERNEDLLTLKTSTGRRVNRVLIQGEPGSGKSTLLNNIAYKWASQFQRADSSQNPDPSLSQFDLVFIIDIYKILDQNDSLAKIIIDQILDETVSEKSLKSYLISNSKRCLFLIDGLDEDSVGILNSTTNEMSHLLYNKLFKQSCVIASIRPYKLHAMGKNQSHFTKVKLTGFSDENIEEYIRKYFAGNKVNYTGLLQQLKEEKHVWSLAGTPLLLLFFCLLWNDPLQARKSLPNSRTKLYQETIESLWKRYHYVKHGVSAADIATDEFKSNLMSFLETLGEVALVSLLGFFELNKILFKNNDFDEATLSLGLKVGLLSKKIRSKQHKTWVKFVHASFQDFCSAVYLANLYYKNIEKCKECMKKLMNMYHIDHHGHVIPEADSYIVVMHISGLFHFCAGCNPETCQLITHQLIANSKGKGSPLFGNIQAERRSLDISLVFELAFEAQLTYKKCNELVRILSSAGCGLGYVLSTWSQTVKPIQYQLDLLESVTDTDHGLMFSIMTHFKMSAKFEFTKCYRIILSMLRYTKQMHCVALKFDLSNAPNQVFHLDEFFDVLVHLTNLQHLHIENIKTPGKLYVSNIHKICHIKLEKLQLEHITLNVNSMTEFLNQNTSLTMLMLHVVCYLPGVNTYDIFNMIEAMSKHKTYSSLVLGGILIGRAVQHLEFIIPHLTKFELMYPCLDDVQDVQKLVSYLQKAEKLEELILGGVTFGTAINSLADQLKFMVNLRELTLFDCGLGNHESHILKDGIIKDCQREHWEIHRMTCGKDPIQQPSLLQELPVQQAIKRCDKCSRSDTEVSRELKRCIRNKTAVYYCKDCQIDQSACAPTYQDILITTLVYILFYGLALFICFFAKFSSILLSLSLLLLLLPGR